MHALVIRPPRLGARLHLRGAVTGGRHAHHRHVVGEQAGDQRGGLVTKARHHVRDQLLRSGIARHTFDGSIHIQADIARLRVTHIGTQQRFLIARKLKAQMGKIQNLAGFDRGGPFRTARCVAPVSGVDRNNLGLHGSGSVRLPHTHALPQVKLAQMAGPIRATAPCPHTAIAARTSRCPGCATAADSVAPQSGATRHIGRAAQATCHQ